jgi:hypothetical protein
VYCIAVSIVSLLASSIGSVPAHQEGLMLAIVGATPSNVLMVSIAPVLIATAQTMGSKPSAATAQSSRSRPAEALAGGTGHCRHFLLSSTALVCFAVLLFTAWRALAFFAAAFAAASTEYSAHVFGGPGDAQLRGLAALLAATEVFWMAIAVSAVCPRSQTRPIARLLRGHNRALLWNVLAVDTVAILCFPSSVVSAVATVQAVHTISFGVLIPILFLVASRAEADRLDLAKATAAITRFGKEVRDFVGASLFRSVHTTRFCSFINQWAVRQKLLHHSRSNCYRAQLWTVSG